jgi:hypothetical protein
MDSAWEIVNLLENCSLLEEFLLQDMQTTGEIGFVLGTCGRIHEPIKHGAHQTVTLNVHIPFEDEHAVPVHTHPASQKPKPSALDIERSATDERVAGFIVVSQEMFTTSWDGYAVLCGRNGETRDKVDFRIECEGSSDGPAEERYLSNPTFIR